LPEISEQYGGDCLKLTSSVLADTDSEEQIAGETVVSVEHLRKSYGDTVAVDDVSFSVGKGEILGILGPNGAGKTCTVECVSGLRIPDSGSIRVLGLHPEVDREEIRENVGVQLQESSLPPKAKVKEVMELFSSLYRRPANSEEILNSLDLWDKRNDYFSHLSGGQKQRLSIALALIGNPKVAILDELTTGLDPVARRETWQFIEKIRSRGVTVILVTHFMDEAERLCDHLIIINHGKVVASGTPGDLAAGGGSLWHMRFVLSRAIPDEVLAQLPEVRKVVHEGPHIEVTGTGDLANAVNRALSKQGVEARDVQIRSESLEDAFMRIVEADVPKRRNGGEAS
jgi:ABC-2 type transport system ATP-binding protein